MIAIILTDIATYLQLQIMNVNPANNDRLILFGEDFWLLMGAMLIQVGLIYFFVMLGYHFYFTINPPQKCCVVASSQEQASTSPRRTPRSAEVQVCDVVHLPVRGRAETIWPHVEFLGGIPDSEEAHSNLCYHNSKTIYPAGGTGGTSLATSSRRDRRPPFLYIRRVETTLMQRFVKARRISC